LGALVVTEFVESDGHSFSNSAKLKSQLAEFRLSGHKCIAALPQTYMNESGFAVRKLRDFFKVIDSQVIVVHDELDLPLGKLRIKYGGGDNGHNGVISVHDHLGTADFVRLRMGLGRPTDSTQPADYVLSGFSKSENQSLTQVTKLGADAIGCLIKDGLEAAQTRFNGAA
jgi:PTH1 family peptidyl-tRNA hydrolase